MSVEQETSLSGEVYSLTKELSKGVYEEFRNKDDEAIRIGLFGDDIDRAYENNDTIFVHQPHYQKEIEEIKLPLLVPVSSLEWYNQNLIQKRYGNKEVYYYAHPPIADNSILDDTRTLLRNVIDSGAVIITDKYEGDVASPIAELVEHARLGEYVLDAFGGDVESRVDVFAGIVTVPDSEGIIAAPSFCDIYKESVARGEITSTPKSGAAVQETITGEEAGKIWEIYKDPFSELGKDDPTHAGFDRTALLDILADPDVTKIVYRVNGEVTTLCIFLHDFEKAPWFNGDFYERNFSEYYKSGNILMFPGIVSDEAKRGNSYATELINLATKLAAKRKTNLLITFECTEISSQYIPRLVTAAINHSGDAEVEGIAEPITRINYYAITRN